MNQTKIYAIFVTAILLLGGPAGYFFTTQDMTLEIQQKDEKIAKALDTLQKAKSSIEKKDEKIETQSGAILECNNLVEKKDGEIKSLKIDLENAYSGISDDIISTEEIAVKKIDKNLDSGTGELLGNSGTVVSKENCPVCEKCENSNKQLVKTSGGAFDEKIVLQSMDLAYNKGLGESGLPYVQGPSKTLLEMYNSDDEVLKAKVGYYCGDDYLDSKVYGKKEKAIVLSYERAYCEDEKYENCPAEIKTKIDEYKSDKVLPTDVVRILTKYDEKFENVNQEFFAVYNHFGERVCSWIRNTSTSGKQSYIQVR